MLESIINPKRTDRGPVKMFFVGLIYASLSVILVKLFFLNGVFYQSAGILVVTFAVMFSLPFMYFLIKTEEQADEQIEGIFSVWKVHKNAIYAFMWLFLGFLVAFSFWYIFLQDSNLFNAQIETYCTINNPGNIENCVLKNSQDNSGSITGEATKGIRFLSIISNNLNVMIFTLLFSLIFGAGAIFILAWNASVIAAAIGVFGEQSINNIPLGVARYMIHGAPEIAAYFVTALAGGMLGIGVIKNGVMNKMFLRLFENAMILLFIAIILLVLAGAVEVYLTPFLFG
ncbi:hypothetical protein COU59_01795 [Candidatus Pacearchaeota archaeon CG10_big_fil_rev_8_21_14_0_10_34_12]|nr:MAG: hypothetical protein COU59_01795 [Candidatus Pacearchaeota archaeon CG10_big_fil_rev_8_21_14_0_10_34_12]